MVNIPIARPITANEELEAIEKVLKSGMLAQGKEVDEFEKVFSNFIGVKNAAAVGNGTIALDLTLKAGRRGNYNTFHFHSDSKFDTLPKS